MRSSPPPSEGQRLKTTLRLLTDCLFNKIFALTQRAAGLRSAFLSLLFFAGWLLLSLLSHPSLEMPSKNATTWETLKTFAKLIAPFIYYGILLYLPFHLARNIAAAYLSDVFELEDEKIARRFIQQAAFTSGYQTIHIREGELPKEFEDHPIVKIGGPGFVTVSLDSVALFERMDGRPHIIGPTRRRIALEGFERLRAVIDLRDQQIGPLTVKDRSLDGIPIAAADVRLLFSVWRGGSPEEREPTLLRPYPFVAEAIERLVYRQGCKATQPHEDSACGNWTGGITGLVITRLRKFINEHRLSEFFASIGAPEKAEMQNIAAQVKETAPSVPAPEEFVPYDELSDLFQEFVNGFTQNAQQRGLELKWVGIGSWQPPEQIILERHQEAWKLSRQNRMRRSPLTLQKIRNEASLQERVRLIQSVPVVAYKEEEEAQTDNLKIMRKLLNAYRAQLMDTKETLEKNNFSVPPELETSLKHLDDIVAHWI